MQPYNLDHIIRDFSKVTKEIVVYLPRNSNLEQIANHRSVNQNIPIIHYCMKGASKVRPQESLVDGRTKAVLTADRHW
jgi:trimethylguanosine synthase